MLKYIADKEHYTEVLSRCEGVKHDLWIATADLKDLYVAKGRDAEPFLAVLDRLLHRGVEVRLLHAKEPGANFRQDFDRFPRSQFRGGHPHRRAVVGGCRRRPSGTGVARPQLRHLPP